MTRHLFITFKVTAEGEVGHPMDHVLTRVDLDEGGQPTAESMAELNRKLRLEIERKERIR